MNAISAASIVRLRPARSPASAASTSSACQSRTSVAGPAAAVARGSPATGAGACSRPSRRSGPDARAGRWSGCRSRPRAARRRGPARGGARRRRRAPGSPGRSLACRVASSGANRTVSAFSARFAPGSVPWPGRIGADEQRAPPPVVTGAPTCSDHAATGHDRRHREPPRALASEREHDREHRDQHEQVRAGEHRGGEQQRRRARAAGRASASNAAVSHSAPSGSESRSPVAPISGGYVATIAAATSPAHSGPRECRLSQPGVVKVDARGVGGLESTAARAVVAIASANTSGISAVPASHCTQ